MYIYIYTCISESDLSRWLNISKLTGCVNSYMLNNLVFATESLDPFAQRLDELAVHYLALDLGDETYALLFSFPGNEGVTLQLQSHHLSHVAPRAVEFCD